MRALQPAILASHALRRLRAVLLMRALQLDKAGQDNWAGLRAVLLMWALQLTNNYIIKNPYLQCVSEFG